MKDITELFEERPKINKIQYTLEPNYVEHQSYEDKLAILVCQIKIWRAKDRKWFNIPKASECLTIRECASIEVTDSSKELINKAVVKFARGTVISQTSKNNASVMVGGKDGDAYFKSTLAEATNDGEVITPETSTYVDDKSSTVSMAVNYDDKGLIDFNRTEEDPALLNPNDIAIGNRIEIRCGYAYSEREFEEMNTTDHFDASKGMNVIFTGFITAASVATPLELECTNMAHVLTYISTPNISEGSTLMVKDFLDDNGKYHLLKNTNIPLAESCKGSTIIVKGGSITDNLTVADVLMAWEDAGILAMIVANDNGSAELRVGLRFSTGLKGNEMPKSDKKYITYRENDTNLFSLIQFDWDVAVDKLNLKRNDKKYLAIKATGFAEGYQPITVTIRKNPDKDDEGWIIDTEDKFQEVNKRKLEPRKKHKYKRKPKKKPKPAIVNGSVVSTKPAFKLTNKVDMSKYNVVTYHSQTKNITDKQLAEEAKQYWMKYSPNGISGSIEIFGDVMVRPTDIVGILDTRQPEKNGYYYVEAVNTTFGDGGYRRELTLPHKLASIKSFKKI